MHRTSKTYSFSFENYLLNVTVLGIGQTLVNKMHMMPVNGLTIVTPSCL